MSNFIDWDRIPEDVEAIVLYKYDVPSYYKMIDGILHVQCYRRDTYEESISKDYSELQHSEGSELHYRPSGPFSPSEIKFLHETTDILHKRINTPEWTIFNNTLPLKQLDAHQRGELFNHWMINKTESMTFLYSGGFMSGRNILWSEDIVYRAKPIVVLTERELFIKEAKHYESVGDMFDSGKFKLVDKS